LILRADDSRREQREQNEGNQSRRAPTNAITTINMPSKCAH
jgi:hypothetical protein